MISYVKKTDPQPLPKEAEDNRFEQIRKAAAGGHRKSDADGIRRRAQQKADDDPL